MYILHCLSLLLTVAQEGTELARVEVSVEGDQEQLIELECRWELHHYLERGGDRHAHKQYDYTLHTCTLILYYLHVQYMLWL